MFTALSFICLLSIQKRFASSVCVHVCMQIAHETSELYVEAWRYRALSLPTLLWEAG